MVIESILYLIEGKYPGDISIRLHQAPGDEINRNSVVAGKRAVTAHDKAFLVVDGIAGNRKVSQHFQHY